MKQAEQQTHEFHPAADLFPMMATDRFGELKDDIATQGLHESIVLCDGKILDGRNRYKACIEVGVEPRFRTYEGDPYAFVWSTNGARRDIENERKAVIKVLCEQHSEAWQKKQAEIAAAANAARSEKAKQRPRTEAGTFVAPVADQIDRRLEQAGSHSDLTRAAKAKAAGVSVGAVARAERLVRESPELAEQVARGDVKPFEAMRKLKRADVLRKTKALPKGKYRVIYSDPPWQYKDTKAFEEYEQTAADSHYPTMSTQELCALGVSELAAEDSVLFCWATFPLLPEALKVISAWGFTYKTAFVWAKGRPNMGNYHRADAELLLLATKGSGVPDEGFVRMSQVQQVTREGRHSSKPEHFRELIDQMYKHGPRIELFRRGDAPEGWEVWGNEATDV